MQGKASEGRGKRRAPKRGKSRRVNFIISAELSDKLIDNPQINVSHVCRTALEHAIDGRAVDRAVLRELQECESARGAVLTALRRVTRFSAKQCGLIVVDPDDLDEEPVCQTDETDEAEPEATQGG
jgi:hypothetical protein